MSVGGQSAVLEVFYKRSKAGVKGTEAWRSCPGGGGKEEGKVERALGWGMVVGRHGEGVQRAASWEAWIPQEPIVWS